MTASRPAFIYTALTFLILLLLIPVIAYAIPGITPGEPIVPCGVGDGEKCNFCDGYELVNNIITFLLFIMTFIAIVSVAIGGLMIVAGGSKESWRTNGKDAVRYAIIGIVIALAAWLIINTIMGTLASNTFRSTDQDGSGIHYPWNDFPSCDGP
jgi:type IV secretory pathway VirB2 component (pilin)